MSRRPRFTWLLDTDQDWREQAACLGAPLEVFFPESVFQSGRPERDVYKLAREFCDRCAVREQCLEDALAHESGGRHGLFGGASPGQRHAIAQGRAAVRWERSYA